MGVLASCIGSLSWPVYQKCCSLRCICWRSCGLRCEDYLWDLFIHSFLNLFWIMCLFLKLNHIKVTQLMLSRTVNMVVITSCVWVQLYASVFHVWPVSTCPDASEESLDFLVLSICTLNLAGTITAFRLYCNGCVLFTC